MRVGTRIKGGTVLFDTKDHPHACGDKTDFDSDVLDGQGSSPCVWGQVAKGRIAECHIRIIPMRVGTSYTFFMKTI